MAVTHALAAMAAMYLILQALMAVLVPCRPPPSSSKPSSAARGHKEVRGLAPIIIVPAAATANINMANAKVCGRMLTSHRVCITLLAS